MKKVTLLVSVAVAGTLLMASCTKAETAKAKSSETVSTAMHNHEGHTMGEHNDAMKTDGTPGELIPQKTCPVLGNPINKDLYVDHDGKRVYVCCQMCIKEFSKNPEKYLKKLSESGEKPETLK